jgi:hypothetical protein
MDVASENYCSKMNKLPFVPQLVGLVLSSRDLRLCETPRNGKNLPEVLRACSNDKITRSLSFQVLNASKIQIERRENVKKDRTATAVGKPV